MERAILESVPPAALTRPGVVSAMITREGRIVDGLVRTGGTPSVRVRDTPEHDPARLELWMGLLARRFGGLAHDLSGPSTGVLAAIETVLEYEPVNESSRALLVDARNGMIRLGRGLQVRPFEASKDDPELSNLGNLESWCQKSIESFDPGDGRLEVVCRAEDVEVRLDGAEAQAILRVLLSNAWKFRVGHVACVAVSARASAGWVELEVDDLGAGFADETSLERAGELGFSSRYGGVGLDLFRVRWVTRDRGATLIQRKAQGATVSVFLRVSP